MYERFTDDARKVFHRANAEAQSFNQEYIDAEHILLGLVKVGGRAADVLTNLHADVCAIVGEINRSLIKEPESLTLGRLPQTPRAKKVVECMIEEARLLGHEHVGDEHILLGLLHLSDGLAPQTLLKHGVSLDRARDEIRKLQGDSSRQ